MVPEEAKRMSQDQRRDDINSGVVKMIQSQDQWLPVKVYGLKKGSEYLRMARPGRK
jgi:hypothetical protein